MCYQCFRQERDEGLRVRRGERERRLSGEQFMLGYALFMGLRREKAGVRGVGF